MKNDLRWSYQPEYPQSALKVIVASLWNILLGWQQANNDPAFQLLRPMKLPTDD